MIRCEMFRNEPIGPGGAWSTLDPRLEVHA